MRDSADLNKLETKTNETKKGQTLTVMVKPQIKPSFPNAKIISKAKCTVPSPLSKENGSTLLKIVIFLINSIE